MGQELVDYLDKKLENMKEGWHGWEIVYDTYDDGKYK